MRRTLLISLVVMLAGAMAWTPTAKAQGWFGGTSITAVRLQVFPGSPALGCFDAPAGLLMMRAWAENVQPGTIVTLLFRSDYRSGQGVSSPDVYVMTTLVDSPGGAAPLIAAWRVPAGVYCYTATVATTSDEARRQIKPWQPTEIPFEVRHFDDEAAP